MSVTDFLLISKQIHLTVIDIQTDIKNHACSKNLRMQNIFIVYIADSVFIFL